MKVRLDSDVCAGFRACLGLCPQVFEMHDDGYALARVSEVPPEFEEVVRLAASQCPTGAISVNEDCG
ncbi:ferredoxin [Hydrocarboniphaga sp.]|uniref:ferredoxin n=1 Tax=Hydrocarboniphaga sp. TaxID=2033016 RepID=UPI003D0D87CF